MAEPLSLADAKAQLRVLHNDEDTLIAAAITDARGWIEDYTGLILTQRQVVEVLAGFGDRLRAWPIASIDAVSYVGVDGVTTALPPADYFAQIARRPAGLSATRWPTLYAGSTVSVTMSAGFATPEAVAAFAPSLIRAMRLLVAGYYSDRETGGLAGDVEVSAKRLCRRFKRWTT